MEDTVIDVQTLVVSEFEEFEEFTWKLAFQMWDNARRVEYFDLLKEPDNNANE